MFANLNADIRMGILYNKRIKHFFLVLTFAKPKCDNVLQPDPRSGEGCNTFLHDFWYIPSFLVQVFTIRSKKTFRNFWPRA